MVYRLAIGLSTEAHRNCIPNAKFGTNVRLKEHKKGLFPSYPLTIGTFTLADFGTALAQANEISFFKLMMDSFKVHDPCGKVGDHLKQQLLTWPYYHQECPKEEGCEHARDYDSVHTSLNFCLLTSNLKHGVFKYFVDYSWVLIGSGYSLTFSSRLFSLIVV